MKRVVFALLVGLSVLVPAQSVVAALTAAEAKELEQIEKALDALETGVSEITLSDGRTVKVKRRKTKYDAVTQKRLEARRAELEAKR